MPLLLITLLARHWGLRHRCKFRWLVDSQFAINRVTSVTSPQYGPTNQPDNADYLSVIRELHTELRRPLSMKWIKSHQDEKREYYTKLSQGAQHNVNVDALATKFHILPKAKPSRTTAHITATNKSIAINRMRFYGNLDANIRFHINGGYIRNYLQTKHSWANRAWDKINMPAFGCHMEKLSAPHHTSHVKFIHDILPLGNHKRHLSKTKDSTIRLCPCCLTEDEVSNEDHHHFIRCKANPSRAAALNKLIKDIRLDDTHHPFATAMSICLTDTLQDPNTPLQIQNASRNHWKKPSTRSRLAGKWRYEAFSQQNGTLWHRKIFWTQNALSTPNAIIRFIKRCYLFTYSHKPYGWVATRCSTE